MLQIYGATAGIMDMIGIPTDFSDMLGFGGFGDNKVVYQDGNLKAGMPASLVTGESRSHPMGAEPSISRDQVLQRMSQFRPDGEDGTGVKVIEKSLSAEEARMGLLIPEHPENRLSSFIQTLSAHKETVLEQALKEAVQWKTKNEFNHITLEERMAMREEISDQLLLAGKDFRRLFEDLLKRHENCQQCQIDCPARNYQPYGVKTKRDCLKHCELMVCKERWDPLGLPYKQQLDTYLEELHGRAAKHKFAQPSLFTNYLDEYHAENGEENLFIDDEDDQYEVVWETPKADQIQQESEHDEKLVHFDFLTHLHSVPNLELYKKNHFANVNRTHSQGLVPALGPPENALATRLSRTRAEIEELVKSKVLTHGKKGPPASP
jgi:hypothetical protein